MIDDVIDFMRRLSEFKEFYSLNWRIIASKIEKFFDWNFISGNLLALNWIYYNFWDIFFSFAQKINYEQILHKVRDEKIFQEPHRRWNLHLKNLYIFLVTWQRLFVLGMNWINFARLLLPWNSKLKCFETLLCVKRKIFCHGNQIETI